VQLQMLSHHLYLMKKQNQTTSCCSQNYILDLFCVHLPEGKRLQARSGTEVFLEWVWGRQVLTAGFEATSRPHRTSGLEKKAPFALATVDTFFYGAVKHIGLPIWQLYWIFYILKMSHAFHLPISVLADSYKASHFQMYPGAQRMVAYGEFRRGYDGDKEDTRLIFYGIRYIVENFLNYRWTEKDVQQAAAFYSTHNAGKTDYPFPKELFEKFVKENDGYFPIKLEALPEGTATHAHVPVYQVRIFLHFLILFFSFLFFLYDLIDNFCILRLLRRENILICAPSLKQY
jgi:hypothetical protein